MAISCNPNDLLASANCILSCLTSGQMEAIQTKLLCDIATVFTGGGGGGGTGPWVLKAGDTMTGTLMMQDASIGFKAAGGADDVFLVRDAAAILADRNGTNAQIFRLYESFTDASNYNRLTLTTNAGGNSQIRTEASGAGVIRMLQVGTGPSEGANIAGSSAIFHSGQSTGSGIRGAILFQQSPAGGGGNSVNALTTTWQISTSGHILPGTNNTFDIGSAASSPRSIFAGTSIVLAAAGAFGWTGESAISSPADGDLIIRNSTSNGFSALIFGSNTSSFAAIGWDAVNGFTLQSGAKTATWRDASTAGSGTVANRYLWGIATPTLSAINTLITYTVASSFYIGGAPAPGTNVSIGTAYALNVAAGVSNFGGDLNIPNVNLVLGTGAGTKIGTATNQKLSFWNKAPIIQPTNAIAAAAFVANTSGIANDTATFGGYTIGQIAAALIATGILT